MRSLLKASASGHVVSQDGRWSEGVSHTHLKARPSSRMVSSLWFQLLPKATCPTSRKEKVSRYFFWKSRRLSVVAVSACARASLPSSTPQRQRSDWRPISATSCSGRRRSQIPQVEMKWRCRQRVCHTKGRRGLAKHHRKKGWRLKKNPGRVRVLSRTRELRRRGLVNSQFYHPDSAIFLHRRAP